MEKVRCEIDIARVEWQVIVLVESSYLHIKKVKNSLIIESKYAFKNQYMGRIYQSCFFHPCMLGERVNWNFGLFSEAPVSHEWKNTL